MISIILFLNVHIKGNVIYENLFHISIKVLVQSNKVCTCLLGMVKVSLQTYTDLQTNELLM